MEIGFGDDKKKRKKAKSSAGGGFQSMNLRKEVLKGILRTGYSVPTPIQKKTIPILMQGRDMVAMARTGSGKTASFLIPMLHKLGQHSSSVGSRGLILSPTRELAIQSIRFFKLLARELTLRPTLLTGGFALDDQFAEMATNPDVIIATPGRLLHVMEEAKLKLKCMEMVVLDEADRLFEMGFQVQIQDILKLCNPARQMALFSATMPTMVASFTAAALHEPVVVRLDAETRVSDTLRLAFFTLRHEQKTAAVLHILRNIIKFDSQPKDNLTIIFVQTKHHCEFLDMVLTQAGYAVSVCHGSMDQEARQLAIADFRACKTQLLIVTDVAARGIDIPMINNVINVAFPPTAKLFVHRVGRAGRQGRMGAAYSLVSLDEMPYMVDLHLFLGRSLRNTPFSMFNLEDTATQTIVEATDAPEADDGYFGGIPETALQPDIEFVNRLLAEFIEISDQHKTTMNAHKLYMKTRPLSSPESVRRCKKLMDSTVAIHPLIKMSKSEVQKSDMISALKSFKPQTTIFEAQHGDTAAPIVRRAIRKRNPLAEDSYVPKRRKGNAGDDILDTLEAEGETEGPQTKSLTLTSFMGKPTQEDAEFFVPYSKGASQYVEMGYALNAGGGKTETMDLVADDNKDMRKQQQVMHWDRKKKKYLKLTPAEAAKRQGKKINEAGARVNLKKDQHLYEKWSAKTKLRIQEPGEAEEQNLIRAGRESQKRINRWKKEEEEPTGAKSELKTAAQIKKDKEAAKAKNAKNAPKTTKKKGKKPGKGKGSQKGGSKKPFFPLTGNTTKNASTNKYTKFSASSKPASAKGSKGKK